MKTHHRLCPYKPAQRTECDHYGTALPDALGYGVSCAVMHYTPEIPCQCDLVLKVEAETVDRAVDALARAATAGRGMYDPSPFVSTGIAMAEILRCKQAA